MQISRISHRLVPLLQLFCCLALDVGTAEKSSAASDNVKNNFVSVGSEATTTTTSEQLPESQSQSSTTSISSPRLPSPRARNIKGVGLGKTESHGRITPALNGAGDEVEDLNPRRDFVTEIEIRIGGFCKKFFAGAEKCEVLLKVLKPYLVFYKGGKFAKKGEDNFAKLENNLNRMIFGIIPKLLLYKNEIESKRLNVISRNTDFTNVKHKSNLLHNAKCNAVKSQSAKRKRSLSESEIDAIIQKQALKNDDRASLAFVSNKKRRKRQNLQTFIPNLWKYKPEDQLIYSFKIQPPQLFPYPTFTIEQSTFDKFDWFNYFNGITSLNPNSKSEHLHKSYKNRNFENEQNKNDFNSFPNRFHSNKGSNKKNCTQRPDLWSNTMSNLPGRIRTTIKSTVKPCVKLITKPTVAPTKAPFKVLTTTTKPLSNFLGHVFPPWPANKTRTKH